MQRRRTETLLRERPALLVSLPRNDIRLAEAALEAGADGLKVHLNVVHHASGTYFGPWAEEERMIRAILAEEAPVGMVPGTAERTITPAEARELAAAGIDFFDAYLQDMPDWLPEETPELSIMAAFGTGDAAGGWELGALAGRCQLLELSIVPGEAYGTALEQADLEAYRTIVERYPELPAIVPTQRAIRPEEVPALLDTGVRGVLIGAIVTGKTPEEIGRVTREFAEAVHAGY